MLKGKYTKTKWYKISDTLGVPHPYCIGPRHVGHAAKYFGGMLGEEAVKSAEEKGIKCCTCKGKLSYKEHEQVLVVKCFKDDNIALQKFLLKNKSECEKNGYAGFVLVKCWD